ncbi:hypothetical protein HYH03_011383 [Edaphochlamys debaryana]|uniref:Uncharacterized protein n=1 Tax=Edaphochlamys debaryana TaxID=47281 RepID=A0A835XUY4_9CHLO|nr:hypothetical protein HYH03_011383 [Edaphochlamys debaryana]|eukprot:KAG2490259.1 hypothetical protein HYH03_011383 [Edaphochlamys debaryana]
MPKDRRRGAGGRGARAPGLAASSGTAASLPSGAPVASVPLAEVRSALRELPGFADALAPARTQREAPSGLHGRNERGKRLVSKLEQCLDELRNVLSAIPAAAAASALPAGPRAALRELRGLADGLAPARTEGGVQPPGEGTGGCLSATKGQALERCLKALSGALSRLPLVSPERAAAIAELLSQEPAAAAALLKLHAAALRPCGADVAGVFDEDELSHSDWSTWLVWVTGLVMELTEAAAPLPPSHHALSALRFVRAMLRAQPFHALSRQLAAAAAALEAGRGGGGEAGSSSGGGGAGSSSGGGTETSSGGGAGSSSGGGTETSSGGGAGRRRKSAPLPAPEPEDSRSKMAYVMARIMLSAGAWIAITANAPLAVYRNVTVEAVSHKLVVPIPKAITGSGTERASGEGCSVPVFQAGEIAAERAACLEEYARGLAESGFLEHATRVTLLMLRRGGEGEGEMRVREALRRLLALWRAQERASGPARLLWAPPSPGDASTAAAGSVNPAAAAHLRSALGGRCVQTAVLVYGVGTLRVADRGPSYGLPAELQTAGLTLLETEEGGARRLSPIALELLLRQLASGSALPPPGPGASLELALGVGRAAVGTAAQGLFPALSELFDTPPPALAEPLLLTAQEALRLAVGALACGRLLLPRQRPSPRLEAQRAEWWRLAGWTTAYGMCTTEEGPLCQLWGLVTEPLLAVWPDGRLAALAGGFLSALHPAFAAAAKPGPHDTVPLTLLAACESARPDGPGFGLLLAALLAYGDPQEGEQLLATVGALGGLGGSPRTGAAGPARSGPVPYARAATSFLRAASGAVGRCGGLGTAGEAPAGPAACVAAAAEPATFGGGGSTSASAATAATAATTAASLAPPRGPAQQLGRMVVFAAAAWGLPLEP